MGGLQIIGEVVARCWGMLLFEIPGFGFTCQEFVQALILIKISIAAIHFVFEFDSSGTGYRSGGSGKRGISEKRKGDEK